ncbi:MAG: DNA primase [Methylovulum sp.]|uniref:DNA primase n=1 Tax=Methylovulum sp. TaxID=1916980 RepID=UPI00260369E4|nr:DNA primase [Methylovulum sp.]MDD2723663.1 DNA primase [Methylovulum sp.]
MSGGRIPRAFIDDLLARVDIVGLIDSQVPLKKMGANYVARCPFHTEKTPSFSVNGNKQFFHCFGCGASGNAITFLMNFNNLDFVEAVGDLAAFVGVDVPREPSTTGEPVAGKIDLQKLYDLMVQASGFYVQQLRSGEAGKQAVAYLKKRDINNDAAKTFLLGYAPQDCQALLGCFNQQDLLDVGLLGINDNGSVYARFRNRVMFPIRDKRGRVIGFGGRVLDDSLPKYLNSPETPLFHKGREVYGLYELLKKNAKPQRILLVEGYMDVIALAQLGVDYAVAALGTATSQAHLELLFRYTSELVFCFDGDNAGRAAIWKAMDAAFPVLKVGRQIRIMLLPEGHDPDSSVREQGLDKFIDCIDTSQVLSDYFFSSLTQEFNLKEMEGMALFANKANAYLEKLPDGLFREMMFSRLKGLSGISKLNVSQNAVTSVLKTKNRRAIPNEHLSLARRVLALLVQNPQMINLVEQENINWQNLRFDGAEKFRDIFQFITRETPISTAQLLEYYRGNADEPIIKQLAALNISETPVGSDVLDEKVEFRYALKQLLGLSEARINNLVEKLAATGDLTQEERDELKKLSNTRIKK